jgi:hypothetical protein
MTKSKRKDCVIGSGYGTSAISGCNIRIEDLYLMDKDAVFSLARIREVTMK